MDAKSKANFINSVTGGQKIPCPNCDTLNEPDSRFCISCGTKLELPKPADAPEKENPKRFCPNCGTENEGDSCFCISCGTKLGQELGTSAEENESPAEDIESGKAYMPKEGTEEVKIENDAGNEEAGSVNASPAFAPIRRPSGGNGAGQRSDEPSPAAPAAEKESAFAKTVPEVPAYEEQESVFAKGLPSWDVVPPQMMVRRKKK